MPYFGEPVERVKIQTTSKTSQRYYTAKRLIRDLLSNTPKFYVVSANFADIFFYGDPVTEVCEVERNWPGKSSSLTGQQKTNLSNRSSGVRTNIA